MTHAIQLSKSWHQPFKISVTRMHLWFWLFSATVLTSCDEKDKYVAPKEQVSEVWLLDRLYFGRAMPEGAQVSDADWGKFIAEVVTPRFPDGLTFWSADGQFQDESGVVIREPSFILEIAHFKSEESDKKLSEVIDAYKVQFQQQSVLRITEQVDVKF